jgi:UDP-glucose 4-epimerase
MSGAVLLTGATGLLGGRLVDVLWDRPVIALGRSAPASRAHVLWRKADLSRLTAADLPAETEAVIYAAQSDRFREFPAEALDVFGVNVAAVALLLDWACGAGVKKFILLSSGGVYGHGDQSFDEDAALPRDVLNYYLGSKASAELLALSYAPFMDVVVLRPFFMYGPEQRESMLIPRLVRSVWSGAPVRLAGDDGIRINPIHVVDAAHAVKAALEVRGSHRINVAGPDVATLREIATAIGAHLGRSPLFEVDPGAAPRHLVGNIARQRELLNRPQVPLAVGLREMCDAFAAQRKERA